VASGRWLIEFEPCSALPVAAAIGDAAKMFRSENGSLQRKTVTPVPCTCQFGTKAIAKAKDRISLPQGTWPMLTGFPNLQ
jgi:hypothetical protein